MKILFETHLNLPFETVRDQFNRDLFNYLTPHWVAFNIKRFDGCKKGDQFVVEVGAGKLRQEWIGIITFEETNANGWSFIDEGKVLPWPLKSWKHHHRVDKISATECRIVDDIQYECASPLMSKLIWPMMWSTFAIRPQLYPKFFKERL